MVAGSYTNAMKGAQASALYDIDGANGVVATQAPPNDGALNTIGPLGVTVDGPAAFNIVAEGEGNMAWLVAGGNLYAVDLKTGAASLAGKIEGLSGTLTDIAWWE